MHTTKREGVLKKVTDKLNLILSTINVPLDMPGLLDTLAPKGACIFWEPSRIPCLFRLNP